MQATEFADLVRRRHATSLLHLAQACGLPVTPTSAQDLAAQSKAQAEADDHAWRAIAYSTWGLDAPTLDLVHHTVDWSRQPCMINRGVLPLRQPGAAVPVDHPNVITLHPRLRRIA